MLTDVADDPDHLEPVKTNEKTWIYGYDIETKAQSLHGNYLKTERIWSSRDKSESPNRFLRLQCRDYYHLVVHSTRDTL